MIRRHAASIMTIATRRWIAAALCVVTTQARAAEPKLVGHWPLGGDARDHSAAANHGVTANTRFATDESAPRGVTIAELDGTTGAVEVRDDPAHAFGTRPFTIAAWVKLDESGTDVPGDVLSKYDPVARRGFHLSIVNRTAATSGQSNWRQVEFGIDGGTEPIVTDCGRPGNAVYVTALCVHDGNLYAGTCEPGIDEAGHVYRYIGGTEWLDCGSPDRANAVSALAVYKGRLYAASAKYRLRGSSLPESPNENLGGRVFRYEGNSRWADCGKLGASEAINGLVVYGGKLFGSSTYAPAGVFLYDDATGWTPIGTPEGRRVEALAVFNGMLWGGAYDAGEIYRYRAADGWKIVGRLPEVTQTYGLAIHRGRLYASTWPTGSVFRHEADDRWTDCGRLGQEKEVMAMAVYNGKLYAGTLPLAEVYRYDGDGQWAKVARLDPTPDVTYRRVWSMVVYQGKLFCGTLPSGHVHSISAGQCASSDRELPTGWRHLAAVREAKRLVLYIDGKQVAERSTGDAAALDVTNTAGLHNGAGAHDFFHGRLCDVRLYDGALGPNEVRALAE